MLSCNNVHVAYGGVPVLKGVSANVRPGSVTALIGPSGAGKSTLLRTLAFLEKPQGGDVTMDGRKYDAQGQEEETSETPWPKVTAVFQQLFLWPHLTLRENIALPLRVGKKHDGNQRIEDLAERFQMRDFLNRHPNEVSGGQRQRAALVRALALNPTYLLLDEITSALDVEQAAAIVLHLDDLKREGIGVLVITHYLGFVQRSADHIIFMDQGNIEESGGRDILDSPASPGLKRYLRAFAQMEDRNFTNGTIK